MPTFTEKDHTEPKVLKDFTGGNKGIILSIREQETIKDLISLKKVKIAEKQAEHNEFIIKSRILKL